MAITLANVLALCPACQLTAEDHEFIASVEKKLDEDLVGCFEGLTHRLELKRAPHRVVAELVRRYIAAGWMVNVVETLTQSKLAVSEPEKAFVLILSPKWS